MRTDLLDAGHADARETDGNAREAFLDVVAGARRGADLRHLHRGQPSARWRLRPPGGSVDFPRASPQIPRPADSGITPQLAQTGLPQGQGGEEAREPHET